jgi:hypothetical protein
MIKFSEAKKKIIWVSMAHTCNPSYLEAKIGRSAVQGQSGTPLQPISGHGGMHLSFQDM